MKKIICLLVTAFSFQASADVTLCGLTIDLDREVHDAAASFQGMLGVYSTTCGDVEISFHHRCENGVYFGMQMKFLDEQYGAMRFDVYSEYQNQAYEYKYTTRRNSLRLYDKVGDRSLPRSFVDIANYTKSRNGELVNIKTEEYVSSFLGHSSKRRRNCNVTSKL